MPKVLIIDDEAGIRFALRRWFERQGWQVQEAVDGDEALQRLADSHDDGDDRLDAVICDVHLPKRSGAALLGMLRTERPELASRVILSTGDDITDAEPGSVLAQHPHVMQKPFDLMTLKALVLKVAGLA